MEGLGALSRGQAMMDNVVQYLMSRSSLGIIAANIRNATQDSFDISIECSVSGTGPVSSTISPMVVDLVFDGAKFGEMQLPQIQTSIWGTTIMILEQTVRIIDMDAYKAYVRSIILDRETRFRLEKGDCNIQALGLQVQCKYAMDVRLGGMAGLQASLVASSRVCDGGPGVCRLSLVVEFTNPSAVQIEHGATCFALQSLEGDLLAELEGRLTIRRGFSRVELTGLDERGALEMQADLARSQVRLVGTGAKEDSWCDATIRNVDVVLQLSAQDRANLGWIQS